MKAHKGEQPFLEFWSTDVFPKIQIDYERLKVQLPSRTQNRLDEKEEKAKRKRKEDKEKKRQEENEKKQTKKKEEDKENKGPEEPPMVAIMTRVLDALKDIKEHRNVSMNLAWTGPVENQSLEEAIPYDKVVAMAIDLFCDT